ncbi:MAG: iron uptake porin [Crocosphaera sp.]|nr:iron uptake porin [Crocosphaera sp.]
MLKVWRVILQEIPIILGLCLLTQNAKAAPINQENWFNNHSEVTQEVFEIDNNNQWIAQNLPEIASPENGLELIRRRRKFKRFQTSTDNTSMSQVTNVSELRDVVPTEWAYEALRSLVERYGCIVGYPDRTFRGDRPLSRWEFAAGLNACLNTIERLLQENVAVLREDIEKLKRLAQEFEQELIAFGARVDNLENRTAFLEDHQFSTTVFFGGEAIMSLVDAAGGSPPGTGKANTVFHYVSRLGLVATFTGRDRLNLTFSSGNFSNAGFANPQVLNTYAALLSHQNDLRNDLIVDSLEYRTAVFDDRVVLTFKPTGFSLTSVLSANTPYIDSGRGAISRFTQNNPILRIGAPTGGVGFDWLIAEPLRLQVAYGSRNDNDPRQGFVGPDNSVVGAQFLYTPSDTVAATVTYVNAYSETGTLDTFTGSFNADTSGLILEPSQINAVGATFQWRFLPNFTFGAWGSYTTTNSVQSNRFANSSTYLFSLGWFDAFDREGDLLTFMFGQPPKLETGNGLVLGEDNATGFHYEIFYRYQLTDRISLTPGFFFVTNPGHRAQNNTIYVGTLRTTFRF